MIGFGQLVVSPYSAGVGRKCFGIYPHLATGTIIEYHGLGLLVSIKGSHSAPRNSVLIIATLGLHRRKRRRHFVMAVL